MNTLKKIYACSFGYDCDGYSNPRIYKFKSEKECVSFCEDVNEGSDGSILVPQTKKETFKYCLDNNINFY